MCQARPDCGTIKCPLEREGFRVRRAPPNRRAMRLETIRRVHPCGHTEKRTMHPDVVT